MKAIQFLVYVYLLLRPYYLFKSGGIQISDIFLILAFILLIINKNNSKKMLKNAIIDNKHFLFFLVLSSIINILYYLAQPDTRYILSCLYFIFNFVAIVLFSCLFENLDDFGLKILNIFKLNLIAQLVIYAIGFGRYYQITRYMGTFNDPNQFGYYILINYSFIHLLTQKFYVDRKRTILYMILSCFLIFKSQSTGMFLGFLVIISLSIITRFKNITLERRKIIKKMTIFFVFIIPILILFILCLNININDVYNNIASTDLIERVSEKINKIDNNDSSKISIWQDRALDYIILYPQYLIFGAGEGGEKRFLKVHHFTEIHSTFPALLFYYGIIPFYFLVKWIRIKLKGLKIEYLIIYIGLIAESFTLANQRQALFWIIIVMAKLLKEENNESRNDSSII